MSLFATLSRSVALAVMLVVTSPAVMAQIAPTDEQRQAAVEIADALRYGHYANITFDEQWSQEAFQTLFLGYPRWSTRLFTESRYRALPPL